MFARTHDEHRDELSQPALSPRRFSTFAQSCAVAETHKLSKLSRAPRDLPTMPQRVTFGAREWRDKVQDSQLLDSLWIISMDMSRGVVGWLELASVKRLPVQHAFRRLFGIQGRKCTGLSIHAILVPFPVSPFRLRHRR